MLTPSRSLTQLSKARLSSLIYLYIKRPILSGAFFVWGEVVEIGNFVVALVLQMLTYD